MEDSGVSPEPMKIRTPLPAEDFGDTAVPKIVPNSISMVDVRKFCIAVLSVAFQLK